MIQTTTEYTLTNNDIEAIRALLKLQGYVGPGVPLPGQFQLWDLFRLINDMAYTHYRLTANAQLKSWMEGIFKEVMETNTSYTIDGKSLTTAGMYLLYMYYQFNAACMTEGGYVPNCISTGFPVGARDLNIGACLSPGDEAFDHAWPWMWFGPANVSLFYAPTTVPAFYDALVTNAHLLQHGLVIKNGSTTTVALEFYGFPNPITEHTLAEVQQFEQSRFDPANWTDSNSFVQNLQKASIWQEQAGTVISILNKPTLTADIYYYLLHLLIGLGTSNQTDQQLAQKIVDAPVSSMEYPNDTFLNQLMYAVLMYLADPMGDFGYDNSQLQDVLNDIGGVIASTTSASTAIKQSVAKSIKILNSNVSYPMIDPYNPDIGINTRMSDTLSALDSARIGLV